MDMSFFLRSVIVAAFLFFLFPPITHAPAAVTPPLYCLGSSPSDMLTPTIAATTAPIASTTGTITAPTNEAAPTTDPTTDPCAAGTVSIQHWWWNHHKDSNGAIGNGMEELINLIKQLIELIKQLFGGGTPSIPTQPETPTPTDATNPTTAPCPSTQPTTGTEAPTAAPTSGQPTIVAPTVASQSAAPKTTGTTPVAINGQLNVCGNKLCNQFNKPIQLRGVSTHGLQWHYACLNDASIKALATDWKADVVRIAMYVDEGGYKTDPAGFTTKVEAVVDLAIANGMYAVIDWHILTPGDPNANLDGAKEFFAVVSKKYADKPNVFYEIANEPNGVSWDQVKTYANQVIPIIRANAPDNIMIVATRGCSSLNMVNGQSTDVVTGAPVAGTNLMYACHFYAASHTDDWRNKLAAAADKLPVFVTEWGTPTYSGDGGNDLASAQQWIDLMAQKGISWTTWNFSADGQSSALLAGGTCPNGPYTTGNLKESGTFIREHILTPADNFPTN